MVEINIIEAFIKQNKQLVIIISCFPDCYPIEVITKLAKLLHLELYIVDYFKDISIDKINEDINKIKEKGVLICGNLKETPDFVINYHIHLGYNKEHIVKILTPKFKEYKTELELKKFINSTLYPKYLIFLKENNINTFINLNDKDINQYEDLIWDVIIKFINNSVYKKN